MGWRGGASERVLVPPRVQLRVCGEGCENEGAHKGVTCTQ